MNKFKIGIGIGLIVFFGVFLIRELVIAIMSQIAFDQYCSHITCFKNCPDHFSRCDDFLSHLKFIIIYLASFGVGVLFLVSSLKNFSLTSLSRET